PGQARLERHAEAVERERDHVVVADEHRDLDQLALVVALGEGRPRLVGDAGSFVELVGRAHQGRVERVPAVGLGTRADPGDLLVGDPDRLGDLAVLGPLVLGPAPPSRAQDQQLSVAGRELPAAEQLAGERQPPAKQPRVADQGREDVQGRGPSRTDPVQKLLGLLVSLALREGSDARGSGHGGARYTNVPLERVPTPSVMFARSERVNLILDGGVRGGGAFAAAKRRFCRRYAANRERMASSTSGKPNRSS